MFHSDEGPDFSRTRCAAEPPRSVLYRDGNFDESWQTVARREALKAQIVKILPWERQNFPARSVKQSWKYMITVLLL